MRKLPLRLGLALLWTGIALADHRTTAGKGWMVDGNTRELTDYEGGLDRNVVHGGRASAYLRSIVPEPKNHAVVAQQVSAERYRGQRIRLSAWLRSDDVRQGAGLWLKVLPGPDGTTPSAYDRKLMTGSNGWQREEIVVDVAPAADRLYFGLFLGGLGAAWIDDVTLEIVDKSVPTTDKQFHLPLELSNGSFED
jgi:hypothetical protein